MAGRASFVRYLIFGAWAILALRLGHLQWYQHAEMTRLAVRQSVVEVEREHVSLQSIGDSVHSVRSTQPVENTAQIENGFCKNANSGSTTP